MASQVASKEKLLQFYLFGIASQEAVFEALLGAMPKVEREREIGTLGTYS